MGRFLEALVVIVFVLAASDGCVIDTAGSCPLRGDAGGCGVEKSDWAARLNRLAVIV